MGSTVQPTPKEIKMTQASNIMYICASSSDAAERAFCLTGTAEHDLNTGASLYAFDDGSSLVIYGREVHAHGSVANARMSLAA
jgi:hypothetical protein